MSFLLGPISGALMAGGVYYGFSTMIQSSTEKHRSDLHILSGRLLEASTTIPAPPPAADRIEHRLFTSLLKSRWNTQVETIFRSFGELDTKAVEWGKRVLYGEDSVQSTKRT